MQPHIIHHVQSWCSSLHAGELHAHGPIVGRKEIKQCSDTCGFTLTVASACSTLNGKLHACCMIPSLEPRLSSSYSSLAFRTVSVEKLDESLGSRLHDSSTTAAADVGGEYTSVRLAGQWGVASLSFALRFCNCVGFAFAFLQPPPPTHTHIHYTYSTHAYSTIQSSVRKMLACQEDGDPPPPTHIHSIHAYSTIYIHLSGKRLLVKKIETPPPPPTHTHTLHMHTIHAVHMHTVLQSSVKKMLACQEDGAPPPPPHTHTHSYTTHAHNTVHII